jgi:hypothetical protein
MGRYWLRVRAEYVVPVMATSREDAMGLDAGDLVDELTAERLYSAELLSASPDSERQSWPSSEQPALPLDERIARDISAAMLAIGQSVTEHFEVVRALSRETMLERVRSYIVDVAQSTARSIVAEGEDDWEARRAAIVAGVDERAELSAKTYLKWRNGNE